MAEMEAALQAMGEEKKSKSAEAVATMKYIENLHLECDWLIKNFELRKEARAGEVDALKRRRRCSRARTTPWYRPARRSIFARHCELACELVSIEAGRMFGTPTTFLAQRLVAKQ